MHPEAVGTQNEDELRVQREEEARRLLESLLVGAVVESGAEQQNAPGAAEAPALAHSHADGSVRSVDSLHMLGGEASVCPAMKHMSHLEVAAIIRASEPNQHRIATRTAEPSKKEVQTAASTHALKPITTEVATQATQAITQQSEAHILLESRQPEPVEIIIETIEQAEHTHERTEIVPVVTQQTESAPPVTITKPVQRPTPTRTSRQPDQSTESVSSPQRRIGKSTTPSLAKTTKTPAKPRIKREARAQLAIHNKEPSVATVAPKLGAKQSEAVAARTATAVPRRVEIQTPAAQPVVELPKPEAVMHLPFVEQSIAPDTSIEDSKAFKTPVEVSELPIASLPIDVNQDEPASENLQAHQQQIHQQFDVLKQTMEPEQVVHAEVLEQFIVRAAEVLQALNIEANPGLDAQEHAEIVLEALFEELITELGLPDTESLRKVLVQSMREDGYIADVQAALKLIDEGLHEQKQLDNAKHRLTQGLAHARQTLYDRLASLAVLVATS